MDHKVMNKHASTLVQQGQGPSESIRFHVGVCFNVSNFDI